MLSARIVSLVVVLTIILVAIFTTQRRYVQSSLEYATTSISTIYEDKLGHSASEINALNSLHPAGWVDDSLINDINEAPPKPAFTDIAQGPAAPMIGVPQTVPSATSKASQSLASSKSKAKSKLKPKPMLPSVELAVSVAPAETNKPASPSPIPANANKIPTTNKIPPPQNSIYQSFYDIGIKHKSDKVSVHTYTKIYEKYLEPFRLKPLRFLEIGLDCDKARGPGPSYGLWLEYLPNVQLYFIEADPVCATTWAPSTHKATIYASDAANTTFLQSVITQSGGDFDVIIDDGGHTMAQQNSAFETFMPMLKKNGLYFVEDLQTSFMEGTYGGGIGQWGTFVERIKVGLDGLMIGRKKGVWSFVDSFECAREICVFTRE